ncbi:RHS repeat domain-containing protein [Stieleria varia]|uniref:RHS repeat domain-containing protein n=1 Tax=Stieleria varia TaxID=2528005 RepID=UPI0018D2454F|nr:RHS repeat-associated core domain-containing protein [Stieleria varia]
MLRLQKSPDGSDVVRTYTDRGQLATIALGSTTIDTRTYDDGGRMLTSVYNNGVSETRTYNVDNTLASISYSGAAIGNYTYGWDDNKNKTSESITGTMSGYGFSVGTSGYDDEDRLVNWERADTNLDQSWNLSLVGDWNSITENGSSQSRTHGPTHEILTVASQAVEHDAKGNQTEIPAVLRPGTDPLKMKWDFENKLIGADIDNDSTDDITYQFDALGRRVGRDDGTTAMVYVQSGQQTIADYTSGTAATSPTYTYLYASYIDEPVLRTGGSGNRYFHRNQQYSITALTDTSGTIQERYAYSAYGMLSIFDGSGTARTSTAEGNRYTYTGREYDESMDVYHYRARMYDPVVGRFCSRDPIGRLLQALAAYLYTDDMPLVYVDADGRSPEDTREKPAETGRECALMYSWIAPDLETEGLLEKMKKLGQCVGSIPFGPGDPRYVNRVTDCFKAAALGDLTDKGEEALTALSHMICCEAFKNKPGVGDPCEKSTRSDKPPGEKPERFPCWDPKDASSPPPQFCGECCNFLSCSRAIKILLKGEGFTGLWGNGSGIKEYHGCLGRCKR